MEKGNYDHRKKKNSAARRQKRICQKIALSKYKVNEIHFKAITMK